MDIAGWLMGTIFVVGMVAMIGFFITKTTGYGRYSTSVFLLLIVLVVSALLLSADKLDKTVLANIFFAIIGFAGGLFTSRDSEASTNPQAKVPKSADNSKTPESAKAG